MIHHLCGACQCLVLYHSAPYISAKHIIIITNNKEGKTMNNDYRYPADYGRTYRFSDYGPYPFVINIEQATLLNDTFRTALWTGTHLQLTLMSIKPGEDIGIEAHDNLDQFLRIEQGQGIVMMGQSRNRMDFQQRVADNYAIIIPAGYWHNLINIGKVPLKLYSIYAPPNHPRGTVHRTKQEAEEHHE